MSFPEPLGNQLFAISAVDWLQKFKPKAVGGFDKSLEYAWKVFEQIADASETPDKKADNLLKSAGRVAGLLGLAINTLKIGEPVVFAPSLLLFIGSLIFAVGGGHVEAVTFHFVRYPAKAY